MERTLIAPGVHLSCDPAEKFNRCRISVHFAFPAERETATAHALLPLVRCSPQASATGPTTAPKPAMASRRDVSARRKRASCCTGLRNTAPMPAAPAYSNAAVLKAPRPAPRCCTSGVLTPNSTAASSARAPPRKAGPWR